MISRRDFLHMLSLLPFTALPLGFFNRVPYVSVGDRRSRKIAITIDDGWYSDKVISMLEALDGTPASFFPVGAVMKHKPDLYRQIIHAGYPLFNHTWDHPDLNGKDVDILTEILGWEEAYRDLDVGTFRPKALRLPGLSGIYNDSIFNIAASLGYEAIFGCTWGSQGVFGASKKSILDDIKPHLTGGSILLFHFVDSDIEVMPDVLKFISDAGLSPVTLNRLPGVPIYDRPRPPRLKPPR